jgi:hypothetical protein
VFALATLEDYVRAAPMEHLAASSEDCSKEILRLDDDIRAGIATVDKFVTLAALALGALVTVGILNSKAVVSILTPYGLAFVLTYLAQIYTDIETRVTLRSYLERLGQVNGNRVVALQSAVLDDGYRNRLSVRLIGVLFLAVTVAMLIISVRTALLVHVPQALLVLHFVGLLLVLATIGAAAWELQTAGRKALRKAVFASS